MEGGIPHEEVARPAELTVCRSVGKVGDFALWVAYGQFGANHMLSHRSGFATGSPDYVRYDMRPRLGQVDLDRDRVGSPAAPAFVHC